VSASYHGAFERLEPLAFNGARAVFRGREAGNSPLLPDPLEVSVLGFHIDKKLSLSN